MHSYTPLTNRSGVYVQDRSGQALKTQLSSMMQYSKGQWSRPSVHLWPNEELVPYDQLTEEEKSQDWLTAGSVTYEGTT